MLKKEISTKQNNKREEQEEKPWKKSKNEEERAQDLLINFNQTLHQTVTS